MSLCWACSVVAVLRCCALLLVVLLWVVPRSAVLLLPASGKCCRVTSTAPQRLLSLFKLKFIHTKRRHAPLQALLTRRQAGYAG